MKPTYMNYIKRAVKLPLENVTEYFPTEVFTEVIFYNGNVLPWYYISNYGRIYSLYTKNFLSQFVDERRYSKVTLRYDKENKKDIFTSVHKIELMSFYPIIENDIFIPHHKDNNPQNNYLGNLAWVTVSENTRFAIDDGYANCKCENNSRSVFSNNQVHEICKLIEMGKTNSEILDILRYPYGKERNRIAAIIRLIRRGQTYLDISKQYDIPGINGRTQYSPDFAYLVCTALSDPNREYRIDELCDLFEVPLEDRKMFANYVQDITRRSRDTYIVNQYPILKSPKPLPKDNEYYKYYY